MSWADWMCPTLEPQHLLRLEQQRRAIEAYDLPQARLMLLQLAELATRQELMLRGAVGRIAELECQVGLEPEHEKAPE